MHCYIQESIVTLHGIGAMSSSAGDLHFPFSIKMKMAVPCAGYTRGRLAPGVCFALLSDSLDPGGADSCNLHPLTPEVLAGHVFGEWEAQQDVRGKDKRKIQSFTALFCPLVFVELLRQFP